MNFKVHFEGDNSPRVLAGYMKATEAFVKRMHKFVSPKSIEFDMYYSADITVQPSLTRQHKGLFWVFVNEKFPRAVGYTIKNNKVTFSDPTNASINQFPLRTNREIFNYAIAGKNR